MIDRIRDNCHLVLAFSPVGKKFRDRAIDFPALFNNCSINWFLGWPEEALTEVAHSFINNFHIDVQNPETKKELEVYMGKIHDMVNNQCSVYFTKMRRNVFVTPKS